MDEALIKTGTWPNVAIEAGSDPHEVMKRYGVNEHTLRTACYDHEQHIKELEGLVRELWAMVKRLYIGDGEHLEGYAERLEEFGIGGNDD